MTTPTLIQDLNLSESWLKVLEQYDCIPGQELSPLIVTITDFEENETVRKTLDEDLLKRNKQSIQTVSETIFPLSLQKLFRNDRQEFYEEYKANFITRITGDLGIKPPPLTLLLTVWMGLI